MLAGVILFAVARFRPLLSAPELALITLLLTVLSVAVLLGLIWLRQHTPITSARRFDEEFRLGERISTALELIDGRIATNDELTSFQIGDAYQQGQSVDARRELPLKWDRNAWIVVGVALVVLALLYFLPNPQTPVDDANTAQQAAIDEAAEDVGDVTEAIANDPTLGADDLLSAHPRALQRARHARAAGLAQLAPDGAAAARQEVGASASGRLAFPGWSVCGSC